MAQKKRYGFVIDIARCIDCRACLVACGAENKVGLKYTRIWVRDSEVQGEFPNLKQTFIPYNCMHCDNPPCIQVCVSGATYKDADNGLVLVDQQACIGCGFCVDACPYNARYLDRERGVVDKCTACVQRLERGQQPACVATCVGKSRLFGDLNDAQSEAAVALKNAKSIQRLEYNANGVNTGPNIYFINGEVSDVNVQPHAPHYTPAELTWKTVLVPAVAAGVGAAFAVQAVYFTKQLIEGEKEYEE